MALVSAVVLPSFLAGGNGSPRAAAARVDRSASPRPAAQARRPSRVARPKPAPAPERPTAQPISRRTVVAVERHAAAKPRPRPVVRHANPRPRPQPRPRVKTGRGAPVSVSLYEQTPSPGALREQGCRAGRRNVGGLTILDFGKPAWNGHTYGTILFSDRFAANKDITTAVYDFAVAYVRCLPRTSKARIVLARGTSNYRLAVPSAYDAGHAWARETMRLTDLIAAHPRVAAHVTSAAAIDVEPAWDRPFRRTRDFYRGYRGRKSGHLLYNYGSLDGGVGSVWNALQAAYVASGRDTRVVPEIYNHKMAHQWASLTKIAIHRYHRPVRFAGVMTQHHARCGCSLEPHEARRALVRALATHVGTVAPSVPPTLTNIRY